MCDFSDYVASYDEAIDVVRQYEDATNSKFLVIKRRTYAPGIVKIINLPRVDAKAAMVRLGALCYRPSLSYMAESDSQLFYCCVESLFVRPRASY